MCYKAKFESYGEETKLTLNLLSNCSITWSVVILLVMRTLVEVSNDGVNIEVCKRQKNIKGTGQGFMRDIQL